MSEMPQGAIKISWKPPARERSDRGREGGFPPPTVWSFFVFQCGIVCSGAHFRGYFHIFLHIISVFNWVLGTYCHIVKKKKKIPLFRKCGISVMYKRLDDVKFISYLILYHSYQDCPIDFHIWHSVPFHDHEIVPPTISWPVHYASVLSHMNHMCVAQSAACAVQ